MSENFIGFFRAKDTKFCDDLINYFEKSDEKKQGITRKGTPDLSIKNSTDLTVLNADSEEIQNYLYELGFCLKQYIEKFPYCNHYAPFTITEPFNIQKYEPNQGYFAWHTERAEITPPLCNRHLVFMTYLNDVTDGGQTEFYHQKMKVQPEKGLTLIWPADWTHTHRGITSPTQVKYIVTGWMNYEQTD